MIKKIKSFFIFLCFCLLIPLVSCSSQEIKLILDYNNASGIQEELMVSVNNDLPRLPTPSDEWNTFEGWYSTKNGIEFKVYDGYRYLVDDGKLNIKNYDIVNNSILFKAKYSPKQINCYITLEGNNEKFNDKTIQVLYGSNMPKLESLTRDYSQFIGWYTMFNGTEIMVHNGINYINGYDILDVNHYNIVNYTIKIYAKYNTSTIKINLNGNTDKYINNSIYIPYGQPISELPILEKDNHIFLGWFSIKNNEEFLVFDKSGFTLNKNLLTKDNYEINNNEINLYAKYEIEKKQVILKLDNDENANSISIYVPYGENITEYVKHIRIKGKVVTKWSTIINDINFTNIFVGPVYESNIILYPAENIYYLVTLNGISNNEIYAEEGESITLPNPEQDGFEFVGWEDAKGNLYKDTLTVNCELILNPIFLNIATKTIVVRTSQFGSNIYTPTSVDGKPSKRDWEDRVDLNDYFNIADLKKYGYGGFNINYTCSMNIIDDGYQHIYIYNNGQISDSFLITQVKIDTSPGKINYSFDFNLLFSQIPNNYISIRYAASGFFNELFYSKGNEWNCSNVVLTVTPYKVK